MEFRNALILLFFCLSMQEVSAQPTWERRFNGVELGTDKLHFANAYFHVIEVEPELLVIDADTGLPTCRTNCGQDALGIIPSIVLTKHCPLLKVTSHRGYLGFVPLPAKAEDAQRFAVIPNKPDPTIFRIRLLRQPIHDRVDLRVSPAPEVSIDHPSIRETKDFCREQQGERLKM